MKRIAIGVLLLVPLGAPAPAAEPPQPLRVFFTVAPAPPPPPDAKAHARTLEQERDAAWSKYDAFYKELKKKHGKDYEKWSGEAKDEARRTYEAYVAKAVDYLRFTIKPKDLEDSIRDITNSVVGKGLARAKVHIELAESAQDAHLVLEALGRYGASKLMRGPKHFVYRVSAGDRLKPAGLAAVPQDWPRPTWWADEECSQYHHYRSEEPWIVFKTIDNERWRDVMNRASACINELIESHGAAILAAGS